MAGSSHDPFITLARIGAPNGVRGAARVKLFGDDPSSLVEYGPLDRADGRGRLAIASLRPGKSPDMLVATFDGVTSREAAQDLNGVELGLLRSELPENDEDDFYHADLIGMEARLMDGSRFGAIIQVADFGAGDLLDIKPERGGASVLVPFTKAVVPSVDIKGGFVVLDPPLGMLDPPKSEKSRAQDTGISDGARSEE